jgi:hypothetical protein
MRNKSEIRLSLEYGIELDDIEHSLLGYPVTQVEF